MNKPIIAPLVALAVLSSMVSVAYGQYGSTGATGGSMGTASPEQLAECQQMGIPRENCNDVTILAKKRLTRQENPSTGSGTPMLSTDSGQMVVFIGVLAAIFGGVSCNVLHQGQRRKTSKDLTLLTFCFVLISIFVLPTHNLSYLISYEK